MRTSLCTTILLSAIVVLTGCKKDDDPAPPASGGGGGGTGTLTETTSPTTQMTIDGTVTSYTVGSSYGWFASNGVTAPPTRKMYGSVLHEQPDTDDLVFAVDLGAFNFTGSLPSDDQFLGFFPTGAVAYGDVEETNDRVAITWWDTSGDEWATYWGTDQSGSSFNITETLPITGSGTTSILVRATFSCKLYLDDGSGQFKQITNGTGVFRFKNS